MLQASTGTPTTALYPALSSMLVHCLTAGQPLDPIIAHMKSLPPATTNSLLFFACVDAHNEERARAVLQVSPQCYRTVVSIAGWSLVLVSHTTWVGLYRTPGPHFLPERLIGPIVIASLVIAV